jgi:Fe-S oxidoreductase
MTNPQGAIAQKFDLYACYQCGKCTGGCPVTLRSKLNIRRLVLEGVLGKDLERLNERQELWDCTTCKTCTLRCPRDINPMNLIIGLRSILVEEGHIPRTLIDALESVHKHGNPWGKPRNKRTDWIKELPDSLKIKDFSQGERAGYLLFVGCAASFDPRIQEIAKALTYNLHRAGIDFGILGNEEQCCGNEIRGMGEIGLFEELMQMNIEKFETYGIKQIITSCPHGFNVLKNEYPQDNFTVAHGTQLLARCLEEGKLPFEKEIKKVVTYHDPCFLGKQNGIFDEPRALLRAIPGLTLKELDRSRERSLCCEGGGGRMWVEASSDSGPRLAEIRVKDAIELGTEILVTACPLCVLTLEDAVKTSGHEENIRVMDVMELVALALGRSTTGSAL